MIWCRQLLLLTAFVSALAGIVVTPRLAPASESATRTLVAANAEFAADLYGQVAEREGNLVLSPYVVSAGLGMVEAGARSETQQQMARALHLVGMSRDELCVAHGALRDEVLALRRPGAVELDFASSLWIQDGFPCLESYRDLAQSCYHSEVGRVDFRGDPERARAEIDAWASAATRGMIPRVSSHDSPDVETRVVWLSAVHFKGLWEHEFDVSETDSGLFFAASGETASVDMMNQRRTFPYFEDDTVQIVQLPYKGSSLSMLLVLPAVASGLPAAEVSLASGGLEQWLAGLDSREVVLTVPRFTISSSIDLRRDLRALGIRRAFREGAADFSGISENPLFLTRVFQRAVVEVSEEGTRAAAVLDVEAAPGLPVPAVFRADRPFLFVIRDAASATVLFMGRVASPEPMGMESTQAN